MVRAYSVLDFLRDTPVLDALLIQATVLQKRSQTITITSGKMNDIPGTRGLK